MDQRVYLPQVRTDRQPLPVPPDPPRRSAASAAWRILNTPISEPAAPEDISSVVEPTMQAGAGLGLRALLRAGNIAGAILPDVVDDLRDVPHAGFDRAFEWAAQSYPRANPSAWFRLATLAQERAAGEYQDWVKHWASQPATPANWTNQARAGLFGSAAKYASRLPDALSYGLREIGYPVSASTIAMAPVAGLAAASLVAPAIYALDPAARERMHPQLEAAESWWNDTADQYPWSFPSIARWVGRKFY